jgi:hypothetical protein
MIMTPLKGKFLTISTVLALLTASAGLGQASPDLAERTTARVDVAQTAAQPSTQTSTWPPAESSAPQEERVRHAALEPATATKSDVSAPQPERQSSRTHSYKTKRVRYADPVDVYSPRVRIYQPRLRFGGLGFRRRWF